MRTLITGGAGSLGTALTKRLLDLQGEVAIYSRDEYKHHVLAEKFKGQEDRLRFYLGDVRDVDRLWYAARSCDRIIHAAALKRIDTCEYNPTEAIDTNVGGSENVVDVALKLRIDALLVSSDKAVDPINTYGATKMLAERQFTKAHHLAGGDTPRFVIVRYGNVLGSRGSVIHAFNKRHTPGKPLVVRSADATRFFMRMSNAVELVLAALEGGKTGEVWIPLLTATTVEDIARYFTGWEAFTHGRAIIETGLHPGEKKHEALWREGEEGLGVVMPNPLNGGYLLVCPDKASRDARQWSDTLPTDYEMLCRTSDVALRTDGNVLRSAIEEELACPSDYPFD